MTCIFGMGQLQTAANAAGHLSCMKVAKWRGTSLKRVGLSFEQFAYLYRKYYPGSDP